MKVGDIVKLSDVDENDDRQLGTVIGFGSYRGDDLLVYKHAESLTEVMWSTGVLGWVLESRLEVQSLAADKERG